MGGKTLPNPMLIQLYITQQQWDNTLRPRQNGCHFAEGIFKCISLNENFRIWNKISLKYVPKGEIENMATFLSDNGLAPNRRQAIIWSNVGMLYWCINGSLGLNVLKGK